MTQRVEIIELESNPEGPFTLYGLRFVGDAYCEFEKFNDDHSMGKKKIVENLQRILAYLKNIIKRGRALERDFRYEGKKNDCLQALPTDEYGQLRLYCLRISDHILILGNGGVKKSGPYQNYPILKRHAEILQKVDRKLKQMQKNGDIIISQHGIIGYQKVVVNV